LSTRERSLPNTITPELLASLHLPELDRRLSLKRAGWIQPTSAGSACEALVDDVAGCVLYCEIVDGHAMKFGTASSLRDRHALNRGTINNILAFQDGRYLGTNRKITDPSTYDKYKRQAPQVIRSGRKIEIWAASLSSQVECQNPLKFNAQHTACRSVEGALNSRFKTIEHGWPARPNSLNSRFDLDTVAGLTHAISALEPDPEVPQGTQGYSRFTTQRGHWLGWLGFKPGGLYKRSPEGRASVVYNRIVEPKMLLWLIEAAGVDSGLFSQAKPGASAASTLGGLSKAIRQAVPYSKVADALRSHRAN